MATQILSAMDETELKEMEAAVEDSLEDFEQGRVYTREEVDAEMRELFPFLAKKYADS